MASSLKKRGSSAMKEAGFTQVQLWLDQEEVTALYSLKKAKWDSKARVIRRLIWDAAWLDPAKQRSR